MVAKRKPAPVSAQEKTTIAGAIKEKIMGSTFPLYYKIRGITEGLEPYYVNVELMGDYVDMYSLEQLQKLGLRINSIKLTNSNPHAITFSVMMADSNGGVVQ